MLRTLLLSDSYTTSKVISLIFGADDQQRNVIYDAFDMVNPKHVWPKFQESVYEDSGAGRRLDLGFGLLSPIDHPWRSIIRILGTRHEKAARFQDLCIVFSTVSPYRLASISGISTSKGNQNS